MQLNNVFLERLKLVMKYSKPKNKKDEGRQEAIYHFACLLQETNKLKKGGE